MQYLKYFQYLILPVISDLASGSPQGSLAPQYRHARAQSWNGSWRTSKPATLVVVSILARRHYTYEEYLAVEAASDIRHEYLEGEIFAMAGGSPEHAALASTVVGVLYRQLSGGTCRPYGSDLRIHVAETGLSTYPDASVICGPMKTADHDRHAATNPTVLFEVLSPSTEAYDRGDKRLHYQKIESVQAIVFIHQSQQEVEVWSRANHRFDQQRYGLGAQIDLPIDLKLSLSELYAGVLS